MKKLVISLVLGAGLVACTDQVAQVQYQAQKQCGYLPQYQAVAQMIAVAASGVAPAGVVIVSGASAIAEAICQGLSMARNSGVNTLLSSCSAKVNGVCVQGEWKEAPEEVPPEAPSGE